VILGPESNRFLLFSCASCVGALALVNVREVMRPLPIETLKQAPEFVLGMTTIRGSPAPVIDAGRLIRPSAATPSPATRFVSLKLGAHCAALAVDAVLDVRILSPDRLMQIPLLLREAGAAVLTLIGALDNELLLVLNAARLVPDSLWSSMQLAEDDT
jgi:purine-binding chemotaxis protein CheW